MTERILVTGGAGFIGSHVVDKLLRHGHDVVVLDNLDPQVHGQRDTPPDYLSRQAEFIHGDVRDRDLLARTVRDCSVVVHLAAAVGLAQSMYEIERFVDVNCRGTAILLECLAGSRTRVQRIVVASSNCLYGEGRVECATCGPLDPGLRTSDNLSAGRFAIYCPRCGAECLPVPTPESAPLEPTTVYATTKRDQEEMVLNVARAYGLSACALRLFNVYGSRQSLANPYTGVAAIFSARLKAGLPPVVFEDGCQSRDFTHVSDVADAFVSAATQAGDVPAVANVGRCEPRTLLALGGMIASCLGVPWEPTITRTARVGDIRQCSADTTVLRARLNTQPSIRLEEGVPELMRWAETASSADRTDRAIAELRSRGLLS